MQEDECKGSNDLLNGKFQVFLVVFDWAMSNGHRINGGVGVCVL